MIYLSGASNAKIIEAARDLPIGLMVQPGNSLYRQIGGYTFWAADSGAFKGKFDGTRYLEFLRGQRDHQSRNLFVTLPDVLGDAVATQKLARQYFTVLLRMGYEPALVLQDGFKPDLILPGVRRYFVGGTTEFKLSRYAADLVQDLSLDFWVHMGRVNSYKRFKYAHDIGCESADGTYLSYGPDRRLPYVQRWFPALAAGEGSI